MNQDNKNILKKNYHDWAIFSIINNTKLFDKPVIGWKIIAGKKVTVDVVFHIIRKFRDEVIIRAVSQKDKEKILKLTAGGDKLNFYLPSDLVLFQTKVKHIERNGDIRVAIPEMIAQIDRRKDLRLFLEKGEKINIKFKKEDHSQNRSAQQFEKVCFDISTGGCSFIISKSEKKYFRLEDKIKHLQLFFNHDKIKLNAEIINIFDEEPNDRNGLVYKGWKVCLKHQYLNEIDKKFVENYVFQFVDFSDVI